MARLLGGQGSLRLNISDCRYRRAESQDLVSFGVSILMPLRWNTQILSSYRQVSISLYQRVSARIYWIFAAHAIARVGRFITAQLAILEANTVTRLPPNRLHRSDMFNKLLRQKPAPLFSESLSTICLRRRSLIAAEFHRLCFSARRPRAGRRCRLQPCNSADARRDRIGMTLPHLVDADYDARNRQYPRAASRLATN